MKIIKKNILFILLVIVSLFCFLKKDTSFTESVVLHVDSNLIFTTGTSMSQSWAPTGKKINNVSLPYMAASDFSSDITLKIVKDGSSANQKPLVDAAINDVVFHSGETGQLTFNFNTLSLKPGERYVFIFDYAEASNNGKLRIPSSVEYDGCYLNGIATGQGIALQISSVKSSHIFWLYSVFMPILSLSMFFMLIFKRKFEEVVALSLSIIVGVLYIAGLFNHLESGIYTLYVLAFIFCFVSAYIYNCTHTDWRQLLSPGLFVFGIFIIIILIYNNNIYRARWDEYTHWGLAVKDMFYFNSFAKHVNSTVMLPWYPPFITLFQYYMEYSNGLFTEELLYIAFQISILSFLIITVRNVYKSNLKYLLPGLSIILFIPIIFFPDIYNSVYVDPLLAIYAAFILTCYYTEPISVFNFLRIAGGLFALTLTKEMGAPIAGLLVIIFFLDTIYRNKKLFSKTILTSCAFLILVFVFFFSWRIYLAVPAPQPDIENNTELAYEQNSSEEGNIPPTVTASPTTTAGFTLQNISNLFTKKAPEWNYKCIKNFIHAMFSENCYNLGIIAVSVLDVFFLLLLASTLLPRTAFFKNDHNLFSLCFFGVLCGFPYLIFLLLSYLFAFSQTEALMLHSYPRYCGSYVTGIVLAMMMYIFIKLCEAANESDSKKSSLSKNCWIVSLSLFLILSIITPLENFVIRNMDTETPPEYVYGRDEFSSILNSFSARSEKIYIVCNNSTGFSYYIFRNYASPLQTQEGAWSLYSSKEDYLKYQKAYPEHSDSSPTVVTPKEWEKQLSTQYDYVFLLHPNELFSDMYFSIFEDPSTIGDGTFYRVKKLKDDNIQLSYIGKIGIKAYK
ncbi:hypothetical protein SAMN05216405_4003 [Lachnospiraceae bacterium NLAE-zl-G231]|nr:hypothetical protein SAMN05216405_4003 [Lachnospiraceae bacterium NLAE-zl-G231]